MQDSWRGKIALHYSCPEKIYWLTSLTPSPTLVNTRARLQKAKLRAHSDYYWNDAVNEWAWTFTDDFDIHV